jgi:opacity protein-like surface antigen
VLQKKILPTDGGDEMQIRKSIFRTNHSFWILESILLSILYVVSGLAQDVECDFYATQNLAEYKAITFSLPGQSNDALSGITRTTIIGSISPGTDITDAVAPPLRLRFNGDDQDLQNGVFDENFGGITKRITLVSAYGTSPADPYNFTIEIEDLGGTGIRCPDSVPCAESWELHIIEPTVESIQREVNIDITSIGDGAGQVTMAGACPAPVINIVGSPLNFDETVVGESRFKNLTIENTALGGPSTADIFVTGSSFTTTNFSSTSEPSITPGSSGPFNVEFKPAITSTLGPLSAMVTIYFYGNPSVASVTVPLNGTAIKLKIVVLLDLSGSMTFNAGGTLMFGDVPEIDSRLYLAKQRLKPFFDMLLLHFENRGEVGFVVFPHPDTSYTVDRSTAGPPYPTGGPPPPPPFPVPADMGPINLTHIDTEIKRPHLNAIDPLLWIPPDETEPGLIAFGDTPLAEGLERSVNRLIPGGAFHKKLLFLITDGAHHADSSPPFAGTRSQPDDYYLPAATNYLKTNGITVYTLGLGVESGGTDEYDQPELQAIAGNTGGLHQDVDLSDALDFTNAIKTQLQTSLDLAPLVDPVDKIDIDDTKQHKVYIDNANSAVTFFLAWQHFQVDLLNFELLTPLCEIINPDIALSHPDIEYISGVGYKIYHIREDYLKDPNTLGEWNLVITYENDNLEGNSNEIYSYSVLAKSALPITAAFDQATYFTGDTIGLEVRLTENGAPVLDARVSADVKVPQNTVNNWLSTNLLSQSQVDSFPRAINGENLTRGYQKRTAIINLLGERFQLRKSTQRLLFYDDGSHGDKVTNDGLYTNLFTETKVPGSYSFNIDVLGSTLTGSIFTRNTIVEQFVDVNFSPDADNSLIVFTPIDTVEGLVRSNVTIILKDKFGNFLGLDREDEIDFTIKEGTGTLLSDTTGFDPNGGYSTIVQYDPETQNPVVGVNFQGKTVTTTIEALEPPKTLALSFHLGIDLAHGEIGDFYDPGFAGTIDIALRLSRSMYLEGLFGWYQFKGKNQVADLSVTQLAGNLKYVFPSSGRTHLFMNGGGGAYHFEAGSTKMGFNLGSGIQFNLSSSVALEAAYNFHNVLDTDPSFRFSAIQGIIRFRF